MFDIQNNTQFLNEIGLANAPEDVKAKLIAGIEDLAQKKLVVRLSEVLPDEQAEEFGSITDEKQAYDWIMTNIPNFNDIVAGILAEIKDDILTHEASVVG